VSSLESLKYQTYNFSIAEYAAILVLTYINKIVNLKFVHFYVKLRLKFR